MSLSLEKLHRLLLEKKFVPINHFFYHGLCRYIEIVSSEHAEHFLLTISSRFEISLKEGDTGYRLKNVPIDSSGRISEKYAQLPDNVEMSKLYDEIDLVKVESIDGSDIESKLLDGYRKNIPLNSVDGNINSLKDNFQQLKRIGNCVTNLNYRAAIFNKVWLSVLNRDDDIECYIIKDYTPETVKKFIITVDLESFLQNFATVASDVEQINQGISRILDKNISTHTGHFYNTLQNSPALINIVQHVQNKRNRYNTMLINFIALMEGSKSKEKDLVSQLDNIMLSKREGNIYSDMDKARLKGNIDRELDKVTKAREEILGNIMKIKERDRNLVLTVDKILFENVVMLSTINNNLLTLSNLCK
jgi:hypothetical protein